MTTWYKDALEALSRSLSPERRASMATLIETWEALEPRPTVQEMRDIVLPVMGNYREVGDGTWEPAKAGFLSVGDHVRVRKDAFDGQLSERLGHIEGRIIALRRGVITVKANDTSNAIIENYTLKPNQLDKRVAH